MTKEKLMEWGCLLYTSISSLEDIYDALSGGSARDAGLVRYGHGSKYYRDIGKRAEETLANYGALSVVRPDPVSYTHLGP